MKQIDLVPEQFEELNRIITGIYDTSQAVHTRISGFFKDIARFVYYDRASIKIYYMNEQGEYEKLSSVTVNWDPDLLKKYDLYYCQIDDTLDIVDKAEPMVIKTSSLFNNEMREQTEYWKEYLLPNNAYFELVANLQLDRSQKYRADISLTRGQSAGDFDDTDLFIIRLFQPHLSKLIATHIEETDNNHVQDKAFYNCIGTCTLNDSCQLIDKNGKFDKLNEVTDNGLLQRIVELCVSMPKDTNTRPAYAEYKMEESPLFLEIYFSPSRLDGSKCNYNCLIYDLSRFLGVTIRQAKEEYHLSEREYEILLCILQGQKNEDIAASLFLSVSSVKKYAATVYSKMGITSQKQILSKLHLF